MRFRGTRLVDNALNGFQHAILASGSLLFPVTLMAAIGASASETGMVVSMTALVLGVASMLQFTRLGTGHLTAMHANPIYLALLISLGRAGGWPLICGMTVFGGAVKIGFSSILPRIRNLFPPQVCGIVIFLNGLGLADIAISCCLGLRHGASWVQLPNIAIASMIFLLLAGLSIQTRFEILRQYSLAIAIVTGYALCALTGQLPLPSGYAAAPLLAMPSFSLPRLSFAWGAALPFLLITMASTADLMGVLVTYQKAEQGDEFTEPDMKSISRGLRVTGGASLVAGMLGGMTTSTGTSNASYCLAIKKVPSKSTPFFAFFLLILAFMPKAIGLLTAMPEPVSGALLLFMGSFMICTGISMMATYLMSTEKILVVGLSIIGASGIPRLALVREASSISTQTLFGSSVAAGSLLAIMLTLVVNLTCPSKRSLRCSSGLASLPKLMDFFERCSRRWSLNKTLYYRSRQVVGELGELISRQLPPETPCVWSLAKTEKELVLTLRVQQGHIHLPDAQPAQDLEHVADDIEHLDRLCASLIRGNCDSLDIMDTDRSSDTIELRWSMQPPQ